MKNKEFVLMNKKVYEKIKQEIIDGDAVKTETLIILFLLKK